MATTAPAPARARRLARIAPWRLGVAIAAPLSLAYLIVAPPSADLAAATYRSDLFARAGLTLWDNGWYAGHHLLGYSVLAPAVGALLGPRVALAVAGVVASGLFGALLSASGFDGGAARAGAAWFAIGFEVELWSGRLPYDLGVAIGLGGLLLLVPSLSGGGGGAGAGSGAAAGRAGAAAGRAGAGRSGRLAGGLALAALAGVTSPVAGAFLALAGVAVALVHGAGARRAGLALAVVALGPALALAYVFPEGGYEPFAASAFWPAFAATIAVGALMAASGRRLLAVGAALYALGLLGAYVLHTPVGGNAARLGPLVAGPIVVAVLWDRRGALLAVAVPVLAYWSVVTPVRDVASLAGDPSVHEAYYAPLLSELGARADGRPLRVEIPLTAAHWEANYVAARFSLARGWERQLDTRYAALFYRPSLSPGAYRAWLLDNAVSYVAVPDVRLDAAGRLEARLIAGGLPYLAPVWRSAHWRLYAVRGAAPLAGPPAVLTSLGDDSFGLSFPRPARVVVRVRFTPYWAVVVRPGPGRACVGPAPGGWTAVSSPAAGSLRIGIRFAPDRIRATSARCAG